MSNKRISKEEDEKEIDFMSKPSLQLAVKRSIQDKTNIQIYWHYCFYNNRLIICTDKRQPIHTKSAY